ncbi:MAG: ATP-dependent DNA helicase RecG [Candidatus Moranbacteria bacterium]|jgi:ATP-dependent DNA helicase RecG|nr:ATP-dependent DNA helicase RecG [Candidatus Moranbacteria bacterium]
MVDLEQKIEEMSGIRVSHIKALHRLGIFTLKDLVFHLPFRYEDYSKVVPISEVIIGEQATVIGKIISVNARRSWTKRKMQLTEAVISDDSGSIQAVWFNQRYLAGALKEGKEIRLSGKIILGKKNLSISNPAWEFSSRDATHTGRLVPIYPETEGITSKWIRWQIGNIFQNDFEIDDPLPEKIVEKLNLHDLKKSLIFAHFPKTENHFKIAQKRFAFSEMFLLQLKSLQIRSQWENESAVAIKDKENITDEFIKGLPFELTSAQKKATKQILSDLEKSHPMNRLLNGDVGSGKTIVAAIAALKVASAGHQVAIMAPTEVLALQHFESFCKIFKDYNINISLLTNSYQLISHNKNSDIKNLKLFENYKLKIENFSRNTTKVKRDDLLRFIKEMKMSIVIGTHALIQKDVQFGKLALVIVDEQHRFGVGQRAFLQQQTTEIFDGVKNKIPHLLTMTATPIPRTLTMALFGNLDISLLDEMPKNRKEIITRVVPAIERKKIYDFVRDQIQQGRQTFVILPLVEQSKAMSEVKAAVSEHQRLSEKIFPDLKLGLLHGRLKSKEKEETMQAFKNKEYDILVSTSVVEVGVDISNATIMIIEDADRFGLSQLHQFRGRVGRGEHQSYCFLFGASSNARLKTMEKYSSGFDIAEKDLKLRGPGEFLGSRQSGLPDITMENLGNIKLIEISRQEALNLLKTDSKLENHPLLQKELEKFKKNVHLE